MLSRLMTRREQFVVGFLGVSIIAGAAAIFLTHRGSASPIKIEPVPATPAPVKGFAPAPPKQATPPAPAVAVEPAKLEEVVVSVRGAVVLPGVYHLEAGSRVADLIKAAGGLAHADLVDINLAGKLIDGTTLIVPAKLDSTDPSAGDPPPVPNPPAYTLAGQSGGAVAAPTTAGPKSGKDQGGALININTASQSELEALPGVGPKLAQQIIKFRAGHTFASTSELVDVPGIGPAKFEALRGLITVR